MAKSKPNLPFSRGGIPDNVTFKGVNDIPSNNKGLIPNSGPGAPDPQAVKIEVELDVNKNATGDVDTKVDPEGFSADSKSWFSKNKGKTAVGTIGAILVAEGIISDRAAAICLDECLPTNYKKSVESGLGLLSRDEMIYQTENDTHCSADNPDCMTYCAAECDDGTWAEALGKAAGKTAGGAANAAAKTAGEASKGLFSGLGVPLTIAAIVIVMIVLVTMM